jgi:hypothetical protein
MMGGWQIKREKKVARKSRQFYVDDPLLKGFADDGYPESRVNFWAS